MCMVCAGAWPLQVREPDQVVVNAHGLNLHVYRTKV